jgi:hypothetical protein
MTRIVLLPILHPQALFPVIPDIVNRESILLFVSDGSPLPTAGMTEKKSCRDLTAEIFSFRPYSQLYPAVFVKGDSRLFSLFLIRISLFSFRHSLRHLHIPAQL